MIAIVDDSDYLFLSKFKWVCRKSKNTYYACTTVRYKGERSEVRMHRAIMNVIGDGAIIDHKDRDGLNNQRSNLRIANTSENGSNRQPSKSGTSKFLGVCLDKGAKKKKWIAQIKKGGVVVKLGRYEFEHEAAIAYDNKAKELHGEFANLKFK